MSKVIDDVIYLVQGDTETIDISMLDDDGAYLPFQVGDKITFTVRKTSLGEEAVLTQTETVTQATAGRCVTLHIPSGKTEDAGYGEFTGVIRVEFANGTVKTIFPSITDEKKLFQDANWKNVRIVAVVNDDE